MLKKRDLQDCHALYELISDPNVMKYVRHKAHSAEEYLFSTKALMEEEEQGLVISRTILSDFGQPIGTINLFDIEHHAGFLGTWIGPPFQGQGYNAKAKEQFLSELFFELEIERVFMRIRKVNEKSLRAAAKLPYAIQANDSFPALYAEINSEQDVYDLFCISKDMFHFYLLQQQNQEEQAM
ncbi:GNAT family N-acetyltransferase [Chryseomicrobium palamuruense]|uniref:GNAT family N-acetyltransferase n=1 Tax=Chryseomicrobium palamuruense TaxID=682973 RepID=A0ABV8UV28_9BACL